MPYVSYKCILAVVVLVNQILSLQKYPYAINGHLRYFGKYFIYATNWGVLIATLAINLDAGLVVIRYFVQAWSKNISSLVPGAVTITLQSRG